MKRLDQHGACRHGRLASERIAGEADQVVRAVGEALSDAAGPGAKRRPTRKAAR